jgi:hypothetical protein
MERSLYRDGIDSHSVRWYVGNREVTIDFHWTGTRWHARREMREWYHFEPTCSLAFDE